MNKKGQSISINTIIIAAIALAVLVVIFVIFTGKFRIFSEGVKDTSLTCEKTCKTSGYSVGSTPSACSGNQFLVSGKFEGMTENQVCCCS